jgi:galactosylceramidase
MKNALFKIMMSGLLTLTGANQAQVAVPENPGFTPEQAAAMEAQMRQDKWAKDVLYPKSLIPAKETRAMVRIDGASGGRRWAGLGATPATAMERQLMTYPPAIRDYILDLMFKPNFGMALTHLKVEVGGDNNSTAAVEPSFAHTREEMANPNFHRGGNYWLMRQARDRNPRIELGALAWTQPYWVGNGTGRNDNASFFTLESAEYFVKFYEGARKTWGLEMQYFSAEQNERYPAGQRDWIVKNLRPAFDKAGFPNVQFVLDNGGWPLRAENKDPELLKHIAALGRHYVENHENNVSTPEAQASGKPLWNAEMWSRVGKTWPLAMYLAESLARCYVDAKTTQFTSWPILGGGLPGSMYGQTGLMLANKPWSGYYEIYPTVWLAAHFNQFAPMGWKTVDSGCGKLFVEPCPTYDRAVLGPPEKRKSQERARLHYLTLQSPDQKDYSIIVVNTSPFLRTLDVEVKSLPAKPLHQWVSTEQEQFIRTGSIDTGSGKFTLAVQPWSVYSLTTTTGQQKGAALQPVPADSVLPLPYKDDFESYSIGGDARYQSCSAGYFETYQAAGESKTLRQVVPAKGLTWSIPKDNYPCVALGDIRWGDYEVSSDALLEGKGTIALWARVDAFRDHGIAGYYLRVDQDGKWELGVSNNRRGRNRFYTEKSLANGQVGGFRAEAWHKLAIRAQGSQLKASLDGKPLADVTDSTYAKGAVGYSTWAEGIQKDAEDMKKAMVIGTPYGHARFDNLIVQP